MAGESYTTPSGRTVTVPVYTDAADAPVAFKDFADSLGEGGSIDLDSEREGQLIQGDGADGWATGMALKVVQDLPADDDPNYAIGDAVFVLGDVTQNSASRRFWSRAAETTETWNDTTYTVYTFTEPITAASVALTDEAKERIADEDILRAVADATDPEDLIAEYGDVLKDV